VAEHHQEQPDDPPHARVIGELDGKLRKVDLRLLARQRFETEFELGRFRRGQSRRTSLTAVYSP
jgi:hypothetical protein